MTPSLIHHLFTGLLDLALPNLCLLCEKHLQEGERYVCAGCWRRLVVFPDRSASPFRSLRGSLDTLWIGWDYDERMKRIVHHFKYRARPDFAELLIREWLACIPHTEKLREADLLLPVPIHSARRRWRGYNQSELLADQLGQALNLPVAESQVLRVVNTPSQTLLDRGQRWRSVAQAFQATAEARFQNQCVVIVDDLATSGATLHALASLLREQGAASVSAAVLTSPALEGGS
jgi:competence protein ComFC